MVGVSLSFSPHLLPPSMHLPFTFFAFHHNEYVNFVLSQRFARKWK